MLEAKIQDDLDHYDEIIQQRNVVNAAKDEWQECTEITKAKKKKYEAEVSHLIEILQGDDPFSKPIPTDEPKSDEAAVPDDWRTLDVHHLQRCGVTEAICEKLAEAGFNTLGELQDKMKSTGQWWWKDIKGIGESKSEPILDAMNAIIMGAEQQQDDGEEIHADFEVVVDEVTVDETESTEQEANSLDDI